MRRTCALTVASRAWSGSPVSALVMPPASAAGTWHSLGVNRRAVRPRRGDGVGLRGPGPRNPTLARPLYRPAPRSTTVASTDGSGYQSADTMLACRPASSVTRSRACACVGLVPSMAGATVCASVMTTR
ncbi:hypothetical protein SSPS47_01805 [Streptomyces sp. S4.7]|nr:hypothetical protein SSPS47_01805 [Streptomyces sp. S4.7]